MPDPNPTAAEATSLPYLFSATTLKKILEKVKSASVPALFTQDYLAKTLAFPGGTARPAIPLLKRLGFLAKDGSPTELYKTFRNDTKSGEAMAAGLKRAFAPLYVLNESVHNASKEDLKGYIVQITGAEPDSRQVQAIESTFTVLKDMAKFTKGELAEAVEEEPEPEEEREEQQTREKDPDRGQRGLGMNLAYTINLNLPPATDIKVFDAIFKSLREHLLRK
jgi:hypothetical protein